MEIKYILEQSLMQIKAQGKLLISGEYLVLEGALAFAMPCKFGQTLDIKFENADANMLHWQSVDNTGIIWFEGQFDKSKGDWISTPISPTSQTLKLIFETLSTESPTLWKQAVKMQTKADFPLEWGLGSSSTLLYLLGNAFEVDAFALNKKLFKGSGYDIACAGAQTPILYRLKEDMPEWEPINWNPSYSQKLFFVYLGKKQSSRDEINRFQNTKKSHVEAIEQISALSSGIAANLHDLTLFMENIRKHEEIMSSVLGLNTIQNIHFHDFNGIVKSLGAWGGDFALAVSDEENIPQYFSRKGYKICLPFSEMAYL